MRLVRVSGDVELIALVACSYTEEMINSSFSASENHIHGIKVLNLYTEDSCIPRSVRAQVSLKIAQILFRTGQSTEALKRIRQALHLTRDPNILEQCFLLTGDIDLGRGNSKHARRRYEQAMEFAGGVDASMEKGSVAAIRWILAMMRFGNTTYPTTEAYEPILSC
jgi:tetratricopeptide (TPR) repeat protein